MTTIDLTPRVTAPTWADAPLEFVRWHLREHPEMYAGFRAHADAYRLANPARRVSADMICHVLRYQTSLHATDDTFAVNNVLTPLYARLYTRQRPDAVMTTRGSLLDAMTDQEWAELLALVPEEHDHA